MQSKPCRADLNLGEFGCGRFAKPFDKVARAGDFNAGVERDDDAIGAVIIARSLDCARASVAESRASASIRSCSEMAMDRPPFSAEGVSGRRTNEGRCD